MSRWRKVRDLRDLRASIAGSSRSAVRLAVRIASLPQRLTAKSRVPPVTRMGDPGFCSSPSFSYTAACSQRAGAVRRSKRGNLGFCAASRTPPTDAGTAEITTALAYLRSSIPPPLIVGRMSTCDGLLSECIAAHTWTLFSAGVERDWFDQTFAYQSALVWQGYRWNRGVHRSARSSSGSSELSSSSSFPTVSDDRTVKVFL